MPNPPDYGYGNLADRAEQGKLRSESTVHEIARRDMQRTPPVSIAEDVVGAFNQAKGRDNALRDAIRRRAAERMRAAGTYAEGPDYYRPASKLKDMR